MRIICVIFLGVLHHPTHGQNTTATTPSPTVTSAAKLDMNTTNPMSTPGSTRVTEKPSAGLPSSPLIPGSPVSTSPTVTPAGTTVSVPATSSSTSRTAHTTINNKDKLTTGPPTTTSSQDTSRQTTRHAAPSPVESTRAPTLNPMHTTADTSGTSTPSASPTDTIKPNPQITQSPTETTPITSTGHTSKVEPFSTASLSTTVPTKNPSSDSVSTSSTSSPQTSGGKQEYEVQCKRDTAAVAKIQCTCDVVNAIWSPQEKDIYQQICQNVMEGAQADTFKFTVNPSSKDQPITGAMITVNSSHLNQMYENMKKEPTNKTTLIAILCSCATLVAIAVVFTGYAIYNRRSYKKNQHHLRDEMQTGENGYHDNPTLEVMEVQPEMQEKKAGLNGDCNDSWIVPMDNLAKDDLPDEEDTHL